MSDKAVNAGVTAQTGFELQRNCALLLILDNYNFYKDKSFFICIEHHDDFLFAFTTDNYKTLQEVYTYQSKKKSGSVWTINADFGEVISKILETGSNLIKDNMPRTEDYRHTLTFISNTNMNLKYNPNQKDKKEGKKLVTTQINEINERQVFSELHSEIRKKINNSVSEYCKKNTKMVDENEFDNLALQWIDFPTKANRQRETLIGIMRSKFPHVADSKAAIDLFIELFRQVEQTYNQKNVANLLDESKRLYANDLQRTLDIIQKEQKTYEKWRTHAESFGNNFKIPISIQDSAKDKIRETFEYLKDFTNLDHMKVQKFIKDNNYSTKHSSLVEMFRSYVSEVKKSENINLNDIDIFFTCLCTYVEIYDYDKDGL